MIRMVAFSACYTWGETSSPELVKTATMTQKVRILILLFLVSALVLSGFGFQAAAPFFQIDTPTPEVEVIQTEESEPSLEAQAGNSDGIALLGIVIFVVIVIPVWLRRKDL